ncbi:hypothetical protein MNBD_ALPHA08-2486 [hydrothermal vent metagenome]|uniref:DUF3572 domain-containing protein n=1 Tax=hydrothermal vent metagenome TaxID=652676 RepID=A0A3B0RFW0_9ZZZZ
MKVVNRLKVPRTKSGLNFQEAETVGAAGFSFLASEPEYFSRFASITGIDLSDVAETAGTREFLGGVLEYLMNDESLLLSFCQNNNFQPASVRSAQLILSGNNSEH